MGARCENTEDMTGVGGTDNHNIDDDVSYRTKLRELAGIRSKGEEIQTTTINNINR